MAGEATGSGGSDLGSPAAGAVAPSRMSDLGMGGNGRNGASQPISDLGMPSSQGALTGQRMTPLTGPFGQNGDMHEDRRQAKQADPEAQTPVEGEEPQVEGEEQPPEQQQDGQPLTPEQQIAKYKEWMDSDQIPEEFLDRPIWVPDGKDGQVPVRLRDIHNNVLLYNDYQRKTTLLAEGTRKNEQLIKGRERWVDDLNSGDAERGLRAIRGVGAEKCLEAIVVKFVQNMARLEKLDPATQAEFLEGQKARDRAYFAEQRLLAIQQQQEQEAQRLQQEQGASAPDVKYVQDAISSALPTIYKELGVIDSPAMDHILSAKFAEAASGVRDPQTKQWITPPTIQLGRAPTKALLTQIVLAAKQEADSWAVPQGALIRTPPPTRPIQGSGPAAKPGQRGNISTPQRSRFSDLANNTRER